MVSRFIRFFQIINCIAILMVGQGTAHAKQKASLYDLPSIWATEDGTATPIGIAKNNLVVMAMIYTSCPNACPMTVAKLQKIERELAAAGIKNVKFVLASFDVKNDKPEKLRTFRVTRKLDPNKWIFLSPKTDGSARELSVALGISYKELGNGDYSHSNIITLLDQEGEIIASIDGLSADHESIIAAAKKTQK